MHKNRTCTRNEKESPKHEPDWQEDGQYICFKTERNHLLWTSCLWDLEKVASTFHRKPGLYPFPLQNPVIFYELNVGMLIATACLCLDLYRIQSYIRKESEIWVLCSFGHTLCSLVWNIPEKKEKIREEYLMKSCNKLIQRYSCIMLSLSYDLHRIVTPSL